MSFEGFRPELLDFPKDLRANNTRDWFRAEPKVRGSILAINRYAALKQPLPAEMIFSAALTGVCFEHYARLAPLQQWLVDVLPQ